MDQELKEEIREARLVIMPSFLAGGSWESPDKSFRLNNRISPEYNLGIRVQIKTSPNKKVVILSPLNRPIKSKDALLIFPFVENGKAEWRYKWVNLSEEIV